jgi:hypothetical protein
MGVSGQRHSPASLYPRGKDLQYPFSGGWVGPRASLDTAARGKIYFIFISSGIKFRNKKKFRYSVPAYTGTV